MDIEDGRYINFQGLLDAKKQKGMKKGKEEGRQEGMHEGKEEVLRRLLLNCTISRAAHDSALHDAAATARPLPTRVLPLTLRLSDGRRGGRGSPVASLPTRSSSLPHPAPAAPAAPRQSFPQPPPCAMRRLVPRGSDRVFSHLALKRDAGPPPSPPLRLYPSTHPSRSKVPETLT